MLLEVGVFRNRSNLIRCLLIHTLPISDICLQLSHDLLVVSDHLLSLALELFFQDLDGEEALFIGFLEVLTLLGLRLL